MRRLPLIIGIIGLSFLAHLLVLRFSPPPLPSQELDDGFYYSSALQLKPYLTHGPDLLREAVSGNLFRGRGLLEKYGLEIPWGALKKGPIHSAFAATVLFLAGSNQPLAVYLVQALLLSLAGVFLYGIGKELGEPVPGILAASGMALYLPFLFVSGAFMQEPLAIFLLTLFYYALFLLPRHRSIGYSLVLGFLLFALSLSKSGLAFFPFFLAGIFFFQRIRGRLRSVSLSQGVSITVSFLVPYFLWLGIVSHQYGRPLIVSSMDKPWRAMFLENVPDFKGWLPDVFFLDHPDSKTADLIEQKGIPIAREGKKFIWPDETQFKKIVLQTYRKKPLQSLGMVFHRIRRLWGEPYPFFWKNFNGLFQPFRWVHRLLLITAVCGGVLWALKRSGPVIALLAAPLYGMLVYGLVHVENRYSMVYVPLALLFSGYFFCLLWRQQSVHRPNAAWVLLTIGVIFLGGLVYNREPAQGWQAFALKPNQVFREEVFLPSGSLEAAHQQNLRMDVQFFSQEFPIDIQINGKSIELPEGSQERALEFPFGSYFEWLKRTQKSVSQMNQWHTFPLPAGILEEGRFNTIDIRPRANFQAAHSLKKQWSLRGDFNEMLSPSVFEGPLFQRSSAETSIFRLIEQGDFRLEGTTRLHNQGLKSSFYDGERWRLDDLSPEGGVQRGHYRIRIEIENRDGQFFIY